MNKWGFKANKRKLRKRLWVKQKGQCYYCTRSVYLPAAGSTKQTKGLATLDHVIPLSMGGAFDPMANCVVACFECNNERGTTDARIFLLQKMGLA